MTTITADILPHVEIGIDDLVAAPRNPNKMPKHKFEALKRFITKHGFAQDIVVRQHPRKPGKWEIVDGHHRVQAVQEIGGFTGLPARDASSLDDAEIVELMLSLNNNRGDLDLTAVSIEFDMLIDGGRSVEDLTTTGFTADEIETLIGATQELTEDELLQDAIISENNRANEESEDLHVFTLEVSLASAKELRKAKTRLRKAGGKLKGEKALTQGLRSILGLDKGDI